MNQWVFLVAGLFILAVTHSRAVPLEENKGGEKLEEGEAEEHRIVKRSDESYSSEEFGRRRGSFGFGRPPFIYPQRRGFLPQVHTSQVFYPFSLSRNDFSQRNSNRKGPIYRKRFPQYYGKRGYYGGHNTYGGPNYYGGYYGNQYHY